MFSELTEIRRLNTVAMDAASSLGPVTGSACMKPCGYCVTVELASRSRHASSKVVGRNLPAASYRSTKRDLTRNVHWRSVGLLLEQLRRQKITDRES